jgi:cation diffusion facilitator CzcD-associated flavoprotein CzcO
MSASSTSLPVVVIGAGPVGLAAAAHLISRGEQPLVFESGASVGASIRAWDHVRLFSPWQYVVDPVSASMLEATGWQQPPADELPTGHDLVDRYLLPLAALPRIAPALHLGTRVVAITRQGFDKMKTEGRDLAPFAVTIRRADGSEEQVLARAVIDASGTYTFPNPLGADGRPALGEPALADRVFYGIPDVLGRHRNRYAGRRVLVAGSGHSAFNVLADLAEVASDAPGTSIAWAIRRAAEGEMYGGGTDDALPARGALGSRMERLVSSGRVQLERGFRIAAVRREGAQVAVVAEDGRVLMADELISTTGFRPDLSLTSELRLALDPAVEAPVALAPLIDPNVHSCGTVPPHGFQELGHPESNFYTVGMKSYGRAPTFLLLTGYEQVRSVVAALVGDMEAARNVMLTLPETGVCSGPATDTDTDTDAAGAASCCGTTSAPAPAPAFVDVLTIETLAAPAGATASACCGGPAPVASDACCALDDEAKAAGEAGCGCAEKAAVAVAPVATGSGTPRCC